MEYVTVFGGSGFVGGRFCEKYSDKIIKIPKEDFNIVTNNVLYFVSTVDNYNVHTDPHLDINTNLNLLVDCLESHKYLNSSNLIFNFISSWFVYGETELPAKETSYCDPKGFYSITKRCAEQLLISYCETFNINYRILRLGNVMGAQDKKTSKKKNAVQYMINEMKEGRSISLYDGGNSYRDYIYIDDCVEAINLVLEKGGLNEIYNIGNGVPVYLNELMYKAKEMIGTSAEILSIPTTDFHKKVQTTNMVLDVSKLKSLGFEPKYDIDTILNKITKLR